MSDQKWVKVMRETAADLAGIKGQKKQIKTLLAAADMIERAPPAARNRIAKALLVRHPGLSRIIPYMPHEPLGPYPNATMQMQAEIALGRTPADVTGLTPREAHEYLSGQPLRYSGPASWLLKDSIGSALRITSVPIAKWILQRFSDPAQKDALMKEHVERGPAGEEIRGRFIDRLDELEESDLTPSVRKTFENASERLRLEFEKEMLRPKNQKRLAPPPAWYQEMPGITLLDHGAQLVMEGREMKHCVATYIGKVRKGTSTILSIRVPTDDGQTLRSTLELDPKTAQVLQHRGIGNAAPPVENTKALAHALDVWLKPQEQQAAEFWAAVADEPARRANPVPDELHARIASALRWPVADTYKFSLPTLRELVLDQELRGDITNVIAGGQQIRRRK